MMVVKPHEGCRTVQAGLAAANDVLRRWHKLLVDVVQIGLWTEIEGKNLHGSVEHGSHTFNFSRLYKD